MTALPTIFSVSCERDRWLVVAPSEHGLPGGRTFERQVLRERDASARMTSPVAIRDGKGDGNYPPPPVRPRRAIPRMP